MKPNIENAVKIRGWMLPEELTWLGEQAQKRKRIVEIGSYMGRSTRALADNTTGKILAVDTWQGSQEHQADLDKKPDKYLFKAFEKNLRDHLRTGKVETLRMTSAKALQQCLVEGRTFDMIWIDASHSYEDVRRDIMGWGPLLEKGGIICGHDYSRFSGLDEAVRESLPNFRVMPYPGSIWFAGDEGIDARVFNTGLRPPKKTIYTLNIGMKYSPEICALTYPLLSGFAEKCGATFTIITERKFPNAPITFEKLQIFELAHKTGADWNIFFDSDALIHPDTYDPTEHLKKDTVLHNGHDMAGNRWKYDNYLRRDGRHIGSGNWFTVASDWCLDLWRPPDDITIEQAIANIQPTAKERQHGITAEHLIDDYMLSRNIARFGLKFQSYLELTHQLRRNMDEYFWHHYLVPIEDRVVTKQAGIPDVKSPEFAGNFYKKGNQIIRKGKISLLKEVLNRWGIKITVEE